MGFHPYLNFAGNCRAAFTRYHEIFGGDLQVMSMADMPGDAPVDPASADLVMHASLTIGSDFLMGSDAPLGEGGEVKNMYVNFDTPGADHARTVFAALANGGKVEVDIAPTFWSPAFGMCTDRFGIPWMVSAQGESPS